MKTTTKKTLASRRAARAYVTTRSASARRWMQEHRCQADAPFDLARCVATARRRLAQRARLLAHRRLKGPVVHYDDWKSVRLRCGRLTGAFTAWTTQRYRVTCKACLKRMHRGRA